MSQLQIELCAASIEAIDLAKKYHFDRIELCQSLEQGGLTPAAGLIQAALEAQVETHVLIRPRAGGFFYNERELQQIQWDIDYAARLGVKGVVVGILKENFDIDKEMLGLMIQRNPQLDWTFHRAFDESIEWKRSLDVLIHLGFKRVLTSGFAKNVEHGLANLAEMSVYADGKIQIMAGGGVHAGNFQKLKAIPNLSSIHFSATQKVLLDEDSAFSETILKIDERKLQRILEAK
ncbi:MAG: copper homeostasis protein CutC [Flavobacteriales bacterium]